MDEDVNLTLHCSNQPDVLKDSSDRFNYLLRILSSGGSMVARSFTVVLEAAEEGGFIAKCIELPVASQGNTRKEAIANVKEAIEGYLEVKAELLGKMTKGERVEVVVKAPPALMA